MLSKMCAYYCYTSLEEVKNNLSVRFWGVTSEKNSLIVHLGSNFHFKCEAQTDAKAFYSLLRKRQKSNIETL